jgi:hypothetical protein
MKKAFSTDDGTIYNCHFHTFTKQHTPRLQGLYIDLIDYLKAMLSDPLVRSHVLFGSDYYMVTQERMSEKEVSVMPRSRLGEDLYKQLAYTNPREFLGLEVREKKVIRKKNPTRR